MQLHKDCRRWVYKRGRVFRSKASTSLGMGALNGQASLLVLLCCVALSLGQAPAASPSTSAAGDGFISAIVRFLQKNSLSVMTLRFKLMPFGWCECQTWNCRTDCSRHGLCAQSVSAIAVYLLWLEWFKNYVLQGTNFATKVRLTKHPPIASPVQFNKMLVKCWTCEPCEMRSHSLASM